MSVPDDLLDVEFERAKQALQRLAQAPVDLLKVNSLGLDVDAILLAKNISKLSPFVSTQLENAVVKALTEVPGEAGLDWARQDPGFPDAGLLYKGQQTGHGIEAKAWYVCGTEITARFKASQTILIGKRVYVVLVAWIMSDIIFGIPKILDYALFDASDVAKVRDSHYHKPVDYLVIEPEDTEQRTANLKQANVAGFKLQTTSKELITQMKLLVEGRWEHPYTDWSRSISKVLRQNLQYREETNFAKIDRINHPDIEEFKEKVLGIEYRGRKIADWRRLLNALAKESEVEERENSLKIMRELYP